LLQSVFTHEPAEFLPTQTIKFHTASIQWQPVWRTAYIYPQTAALWS